MSSIVLPKIVFHYKCVHSKRLFLSKHITLVTGIRPKLNLYKKANSNRHNATKPDILKAAMQLKTKNLAQIESAPGTGSSPYVTIPEATI